MYQKRFIKHLYLYRRRDYEDIVKCTDLNNIYNIKITCEYLCLAGMEFREMEMLTIPPSINKLVTNCPECLCFVMGEKNNISEIIIFESTNCKAAKECPNAPIYHRKYMDHFMEQQFIDDVLTGMFVDDFDGNICLAENCILKYATTTINGIQAQNVFDLLQILITSITTQ